MIWGIIATLSGFAIGYLFIRAIQSRFFTRMFRTRERLPELAVLIRCQESRFHEVQRILWEYRALSVGWVKA
ncbi:hypothetical protein [Paenibacillus cremeus]|uniref:Uncharacterized protein n=1 Tax=Paenibacillus cremeus TaxID=2163881 RepID=A0A559K6R0_9BACL|nr:hypothetical protein [Paenibacillus cremeus]TVY07825.1 hypothetical protein FPZ49_21965 [Paenibacillus cremeus]